MKRRTQGPELDGEVIAGAKNFLLAVVGIFVTITIWIELDIKITQDVLRQWLTIDEYAIVVLSLAPSIFEGIKFNLDPAYEKVKLLRGVSIAGIVFSVFDVITDTVGIHSMVGNFYNLSETIGISQNSALSAFLASSVEWGISLVIGTIIALGPEFVIGGLVLLTIIHVSDFVEALSMLYESILSGVESISRRVKNAKV